MSEVNGPVLGLKAGRLVESGVATASFPPFAGSPFRAGADFEGLSVAGSSWTCLGREGV